MIHRRKAALLLDVLVALAIFSMAALAIAALIERSAEGLARAREAEAASSVARSALALIDAGVESPERLRGPLARLGGQDSGGQGLAVPAAGRDWTLQVETEPSSFVGLSIVTVRVRESDDAGARVLAELREALRRDRRRRTTPRGREMTTARVARPRNGFTLVEVLLALALLVALIGAVLGFAWKLGGDRLAVLEHARRGDAASVVLDRLERDLVTAIAGHSAHGAGISGDEHTIRVLTRGVWLAATREEADQWASDLQGTDLRFDQAVGEVVLRRTGTPDGLTGSGGEVVAQGVKDLRLRYARSGAWADRFDSGAAGGLPDAVEVSIWFGTPGVEEANGPETSIPPDAVRTISIPLSDTALPLETGAGS